MRQAPKSKSTSTVPLHEEKQKQVFTWKVEDGARRNYRRLGKRLARKNRALYRNGSDGTGLIHVGATGACRLIRKASQLAPFIVDTLPMMVTKGGKVVGDLPTAAHLNNMLSSEAFLRRFPAVDQVANTPLYSEDFSIVQPGYHDGGDGKRLLYVGPEAQIADSTETIHRFLDVMDFATNADRTNTVAAALTVLLRQYWPGGKPLALVTSPKSHSGKGTITDLVQGPVGKADILYESTDWPMQLQLQRQLSHNPDIGMICLDNVRLDSAGGRARVIRSGFLESFVTTPEITLAAPGGGEPVRLQNHFLLTINTNDGSLSPDLMNRALPIHLEPKGDVQNRRSPIGNPKLEFLPQNQERIEAELRGMIERWKAAGCPRDERALHPMTLWARTIGGILKVNGFSDFLANYRARRVANDPLRDALAILAAAKPDKALRPIEWAAVAVEQGLVKTLFPTHERDTEKGRERAMGVLMSRHLEELFEATTETTRLRVRLEGGFRRWAGQNPHKRYVFKVVTEETLPVEEERSCEVVDKESVPRAIRAEKPALPVDEDRLYKARDQEPKTSAIRAEKPALPVDEDRLCKARDQEPVPSAIRKEDGTYDFQGTSPMAEAQKYYALRRQGQGITQIANEHGKDQCYVRTRFKLLRLTPQEQLEVHNGKLDPDKAEIIIDNRDKEGIPVARLLQG